MRLWKTCAAAALVMGMTLAGCRLVAGPGTVGYGVTAAYAEPYVVYRSGDPYVYYEGAYWDYPTYYQHYYGPTYVVPRAPRHGGHLSPPPPTVILNGQGGYGGHGGDGGRGEHHGHHGHD
jgi:hypothetical protein